MKTSAPPKIIVHADEPDTLVDIVRAQHPDVVVKGCNSNGALPAKIDAFNPQIVYSIRFAGSSDFPIDALLSPQGPQWISVGGSGVDHLGRWDADRTQVTNSAGVAAHVMAEYVLGGLLHFTMDVAGLLADREDRHWRAARTMGSLHGKTLLIVGLGHTGQAIADRAKAFSMQVIGTRANPKPMKNVDQVHRSEDLVGLWGRADYIAVCVPLLDATRGLVNDDAFHAMKPGCILADISRGGVVEQAALVSALERGKIAGAVIDVFETEPLPANHRLWQQKNVIISPHCSSVFEGWEQASIKMFCENLTRWREGKSLQNLVVPSKGY